MRTTNLTRYTCDRCRTSTVMADGNAPGWHDVTRYRADSTTDSALLCEKCYSKYIDLAAKHDREYMQFMTTPDIDKEA